jgi:hypothetical protein
MFRRFALVVALTSLASLLLTSCSGNTGIPPSQSSAVPTFHKAHAGRRAAILEASVTIGTTHIAANNPDVLGGDLIDDGQTDYTQPFFATALNTMGMTALRFPAGYISNNYHYDKNTAGEPSTLCYNGVGSNDTVQKSYGVAGTRSVHYVVNGANNYACNNWIGKADPANLLQYLTGSGSGNLNCPISQCKRYTYTNEMYETGWDDESYHDTANCPPKAQPHDVNCYIAHFGLAQTAMAAVNSRAVLCADADPQQQGVMNWDATVFASAHPKCVDAHYYAGNSNSDSTLLQLPGVSTNGFTKTFVSTLKTELAMAGLSNDPIIIGEYGSAPNLSQMPVQGVSIVQAIFDAEMIGEMLQDGIAMAHVHTAISQCGPPFVVTGQNPYGSWLGFTGPMMVSYGLQTSGTCVASRVSGVPGQGTILPPGNALVVASHFVKSGEHIVSNTVTESTGNVSCYSTTLGNSYGLMCVNRNMVNGYALTINVNGNKTSGNGGTGYYYDKEIFDLTQGSNAKWNGPTSFTVPSWSPSVPLTVILNPWSITFIPLG